MSGLDPEDIDAFIADKEPDIKAAMEYARRAEKSLPSDRWTDGVAGAEAVARGIRSLFEMNEMLSGAFLTIWQEKVQAGTDATRLHHADSKYVRAEAE